MTALPVASVTSLTVGLGPPVTVMAESASGAPVILSVVLTVIADLPAIDA